MVLLFRVLKNFRVTEGHADGADDRGSSLDEMTVDPDVPFVANPSCKWSGGADAKGLFKNLPRVPVRVENNVFL